MTEPWWPLHEIGFTKPQMLWLIDHLSELRNGDWPDQPANYQKRLKQACKPARVKGYEGLCIACPYSTCLNPREKTPGRIRKERNINRVLEIAAEVDYRLGRIMDYISGWPRPTRKIYRQKGRR